MELKQQLDAIESLLPLLQDYRNGKMIIHPEQKEVLTQVYIDIYKVRPNVSCGSCVMHYLNQFYSFFEMHSGIQPLDTITPPEPVEPTPEPEPPIKKKRNAK